MHAGCHAIGLKMDLQHTSSPWYLASAILYGEGQETYVYVYTIDIENFGFTHVKWKAGLCKLVVDGSSIIPLLTLHDLLLFTLHYVDPIRPPVIGI